MAQGHRLILRPKKYWKWQLLPSIKRSQSTEEGIETTNKAGTFKPAPDALCYLPSKEILNFFSVYSELIRKPTPSSGIVAGRYIIARI